MRRSASEIIRNLEVRIDRLEAMKRTASMRRTAYSLDRHIKGEIVDLINDDFSARNGRLDTRNTDIEIEEDGSGKSGATYLLCSAEDGNSGETYYVIVSVDRRDYEVEMAYDNWNDAKSDFDGWTR